ncbi:MAG: hypothetical protein Tsb0019_03750 [Roseibium sp.]
MTGVTENAAGDTPPTISVSSAAELQEALANATGGETILLEEGNYGSIEILKLEFSSEVTIRSASAENLATFETLEIAGSSNISFDMIEVDFTPDENTYSWDSAIRISDSSGITFSNSDINGGPAVNGVPPETEAGGLDETGNVLGLPAGRGFTITRCTDITIESCEVSEFENGIVANQTDGLDVLNNEIHHLRSTPLRGGDLDQVVVDGNEFHTFEPWQFGGAGDHGDMVHFWTRPNSQDVASQDITITNNVFQQGEGEALLGIYLDDNGNELGFENVVISGNILYNGNRQGIRIENGDGVVIESNTLLQSSGDEFDGPTIILKDGTTNVSIVDNIVANEMSLGDTENSIVTVENNLVVQSHDPNDKNYAGNLFVNPFAGSQAELIDLQALPNGIVAEMGVGAPLTAYHSTSEGGLSGYIVSEFGDGLDSLHHTFDIAGIVGTDGDIDLNGATIEWSFGDGTTAGGNQVIHTFEQSGLYNIKATINFADGQTLHLSKTIEVNNPIAILADFNDGAKDLSDTANVIHISDSVTFETVGTEQAVRLNGGTVEFESSPDFYNNSEYTLLVDFKKDAGQESAFGRLVNFSGSFAVNVEENGLAVLVKTDAGSQWIRTGDIGLNDSEWHSLALTFSNLEGTATLYVDNVEVGRIEGLDGAIQAGIEGHSIYLGSPWGASFPGLIDNFAFATGAMTAEEIERSSSVLENVNSTAGDSDPTPGDGTDPIDRNLIEGTQSGEIIDGTDAADEIHGVGGQDRIYAGAGDDLVYMGDGNWGLVKGEAGDDIINGGVANDVIFGDEGNDILIGGDGADKLFGGDGNDYLSGGTGRNKLYGEAGDDYLIVGDDDYNLLDGGDGNDTLIGGEGNGTHFGGAGNDLLKSGGGDDNMTGGEGADTFVFTANAGKDVINDFDAAEDVLVFQGLAFQSREDVMLSAFEVHDDLILKLDGADAAFSWSNSNYLRLSDFNLEDLALSNIELFS